MSNPTNVVLYDGECALCTFQMKLLTWLDWCNVVTLIPIADPRTAALAPTLTTEALQAAIHCLARDGRIYRGARCLRFVGMRMPLLVPLALVLWIPGVIVIAEWIYQWISRHRYILSRVFGCKEACALMPQRRNSATVAPEQRKV